MPSIAIPDALRNSLANSSPLPHAIPSQYPWLEDSTHTSASNPDEWLTENSEIIPLGIVLREDEMRSMACAAWAIVLAQYTGRKDACFGLLSYQQDDDISMEAFAIDCGETLTVRDLITRVKNQPQRMAKNVDTRCRDIGVLRNYLALTLHPANDITNLDHLCMSPPDGSALILWIVRKEDCITLRTAFDPNVVARPEIRRVMSHFSHALHKIMSLELQDAFIGDLNLLTSEDDAQLRQWNSHTAEPVNDLLHILFQESAKSNPENLALLYSAKAITYEELDLMSSNLALQILQADDSSGQMIPICIEKSPELIISMIAVLKANKTFIPIDPISSRTRLDYLLASLQPKIALVSEDVHELHLFDSRVKELLVSPSTVKVKPMRQKNQTNQAPEDFDSAQPAYILFTSGSTGTPKGVVVEHRNICTSLKELGRNFNLNNETRMLQYTSSTFDPSILEIFGTLLHGGSVCIPTETERLNNIPKAIKEMGVNTAVFVPSVLKLLRPEEIPTVKKLIVGGEKLTHSLIEIWAEQMHVINAYGPTETCICSLANLKVLPERFGSNIGTPIACRAWVANPNNERQIIPIGAIGELWIEGPTVARGYLNNLAATEASFASSLPWTAGGDPSRAYRTGDLVRYLPNGELLFLGRKDNQVKLNGHRIELEEIEACICRYSLVAGASVQLQNIGDSTVLATFFMPKDTSNQVDDICHPLNWSENDFDKLLSYLQQQLPTYMVPEYLVPVNFIPRMTSGKVDQHTLTAILEQSRLNRRQSDLCDKSDENQDLSESHRAMKDLWAKVLEIPRSSISTSDRFLHLGGNSIKAMKLVSAARSSGMVLTVGELLKNSTIGELNPICTGQTKSTKTARPESVLQAPSPQKYTPTWIQMVSLTTVGGFPEGNYTHVVIDLRGRLDLTRLCEACQNLVAKNEILRTHYSLRDGAIEAIVLEQVEAPLIKFNSQSEALKHWESAPSVCFDRQLVTFSYVTMDENSTHFALGLQHSQYDAWTVPLLLRQLQDTYNGRLVSPSTPFSAYATRLPRETNPEAVTFWKEQLGDVPMTLISDISSEGDEPDGHFQRIIRLSPSQFTFATVICSAWALVLSKHANTGRVVFGGAVSGRNMKMEGILDVVGPCINMLPFPIDVATCATYHELLQNVRDFQMATLPYEAMPMPDIINHCTNWSPTAIFGSIVQHLDITFDIAPVSQAKLGDELDQLEWKFLETKKKYGRCRATDIYVFSTILRDGSADVHLKFNPSRISSDLAGVLFGELCEHIISALRSPEEKTSGSQ